MTEQQEIEKKLKMKFGKPFFVNKNITLEPNGYEAPYININGEPHEREDVLLLYRALYQALEWCDKGWCPGASL